MTVRLYVLIYYCLSLFSIICLLLIYDVICVKVCKFKYTNTHLFERSFNCNEKKSIKLA